MKKLIIVGAGGFGREAIYLAEDIKRSYETDWEIGGFIDDNLKALDNVDIDYKIIGRISDWEIKNDEVYAIGIANPQVKCKIINYLFSKGAHFISLISPRAYIEKKAKIGIGCIVTPGVIVGDCANIGDFVNLAGCMVGQDCEIGDFSTITGFANTTTAKIGKRVFMGSQSLVLNGLKVGDDVFICAGSIVFSNIKAGLKVLGNPAKKFNF